jgi:hypothetical protein
MNPHHSFLDASLNFGKAVTLRKVSYVLYIKTVSILFEIIFTGTYFVSSSHIEHSQKKIWHKTVVNYLEMRLQEYTEMMYAGRYFNDPQLVTRRFLGGM